MKRSSWFRGFAAGLIVAMICTGGFVLASGGPSTVTGYINEKLHITFNGKPFKPAEADGSELTPVLINNRTYLPVRAVAEKAGVLVDYDDATSEVILWSENELLNRANLVAGYLKHQDFTQLARFVHKEKGVTFSPYSYVESSSVNLSPSKVSALNPSEEFTWGVYDGSGEPIELSVGEYFGRFVFNLDYFQAKCIGIDLLVKSGNTISNLDTAFPGGHFVEFHIPGVNPEYEGIDWGSLRLVFEDAGGEWMLVGVVHDQWTV